MRRDYGDRPPRPWDKGAGIWGDLSLSIDEPKAKPRETAIPVSGNIPVQLCNALARRGFWKYSQVEEKNATAIFDGMLKAVEDKVYNGIRAKRY